MVGGSQASNPQAQIGLAGSNNGSNLHIARNLFTYTDQATVTKGRHQITAGVWFQRLQSNETLALSQFGQMTFTGLPALLAGTGSFLYDPVADAAELALLVRRLLRRGRHPLSPRLTLSLGFRDEFSTGWNEAYGKASNYTFANGVISSQPDDWKFAVHDQPREISSATSNRAGVEPLGFQDGDSRRIRHVQRFAGFAWLPRRSKCALQSDVHHCLGKHREFKSSD